MRHSACGPSRRIFIRTRRTGLTATQAQIHRTSGRETAPLRDTQFGPPGTADAPTIRQLIDRCKPLDVNSTYAYLLLCHHFADTCVVARRHGDITGFVSAYRPPRSPETLFIWQVAVHPEARGESLGNHMIANLLRRETLNGIRQIETTVSPSNLASRGMFERLAKHLDVELREQELFDETAFGDEAHETEVLFKLGPLLKGKNEGVKDI
jgi:L-2,4-diaminobutyric acid acetyltransferase